MRLQVLQDPFQTARAGVCIVLHTAWLGFCWLCSSCVTSPVFSGRDDPGAAWLISTWSGFEGGMLLT